MWAPLIRALDNNKRTARFKLNDQFVLLGDLGVGGDYRGMVKYLIRFQVMRPYRFFFLCSLAAALELAAQTAVDVPRAEEKQKQNNAIAKEQEKHAQATTTVEFSGEQAFKEKDLRSA